MKGGQWRAGSSQEVPGATLYIHMYGGDVIEAFPSTGLRMTDDSLLVLNGVETVAIFPRAEVYFASYRREPAPYAF